MTNVRTLAATRGLALALIVVPEPLSARQGAADSTVTRSGAIFVQVTDTSINPIAAEVVLPALALGVRLSDEGTLLLVNVPDGIYLIQARHIGHATDWRLVRVARDTARVEFVLPPANPAAARSDARSRGEGAIAQSRLLAFLARTSAIPSGSFLTRKEIQRRRARTMTALLGRMRDLRVDRAKSGGVAIRSTDAAGPVCTSGMLVFVDAVQLEDPGAATVVETENEAAEPRRPRAEWRLTGGPAAEAASGALRWLAAVGRGLVTAPPSPDPPAASRRAPARAEIDRLPMSSVTAVEIYPTHAGVPPEFRVPGAECGVVLAWTG